MQKKIKKPQFALFWSVFWPAVNFLAGIYYPGASATLFGVSKKLGYFGRILLGKGK